MKDQKIHFITIILLLVVIISGGYGIISLLNGKASKVNYNKKTLSYYEKCTNKLINHNAILCASIKNEIKKTNSH